MPTFHLCPHCLAHKFRVAIRPLYLVFSGAVQADRRVARAHMRIVCVVCGRVGLEDPLLSTPPSSEGARKEKFSVEGAVSVETTQKREHYGEREELALVLGRCSDRAVVCDKLPDSVAYPVVFERNGLAQVARCTAHVAGRVGWKPWEGRRGHVDGWSAFWGMCMGAL